MKAAVHLRYGSPEVLSIQEVEIPTPKDNEVLIRVYATTVNRTDCHILSGMPFFMRFFTGLFKPGLIVSGTDFAGQIEATGKDVKYFKAGDRLMGFDFWGLRSHAHYLTLPETKEMIAMPANISYEQAAACIEGAFYALNVINKMSPMAGQKALVNGATGAIGSSMVQFFKFYGTYITAVCSGENSELVRSLGADKVIDYKTEDFTKDSGQYDFVFDAANNSTFGRCKHLLKKNGIYSSSGAPNPFLLLATSLSGGKKVIFAPPKNLKACLIFIKDLVANGSFKPVIDKIYPLDKIADAYTYVAGGQKKGNVIITMGA
ncbi:MAG: NAD(P)-dependent alcohol dehydrogenase [Chitinophagaceae bacterium]